MDREAWHAVIHGVAKSRTWSGLSHPPQVHPDPGLHCLIHPRSMKILVYTASYTPGPPGSWSTLPHPPQVHPDPGLHCLIRPRSRRILVCSVSSAPGPPGSWSALLTVGWGGGVWGALSPAPHGADVGRGRLFYTVGAELCPDCLGHGERL